MDESRVEGAGRGGWAARAMLVAMALAAAGCSGNYAADPEDAPPSPQRRDYNAPGDETLFGNEGLTLDRILEGSLIDGDGPDAAEGALPVNRYLWQASLDTLSFLPLASTDPFTGVIATEWAGAPADPRQRYKVTVYVTKPQLEASALRVAVFREDRLEDGTWIPQAVSRETVLRLEDAILTRARQIRIAEVEGADGAG